MDVCLQARLTSDYSQRLHARGTEGSVEKLAEGAECKSG